MFVLLSPCLGRTPSVVLVDDLNHMANYMTVSWACHFLPVLTFTSGQATLAS